MREITRVAALGALGLLSAAGGCRSRPPLAIEPHVDVPRFMGDWYVIACIPTRIERAAYAPKESYRLDPDGRVRTVFTFRDGAFDGPSKTYTPVGFVRAGSGGAVWGMRFVWPIEADYRIMYVDPDYTLTVIGREKRDYAWIMARAPRIAAADYERLRTLLASQGYDVSALRRMPQPGSP
ncbi:MAG TPA: lipocalin family protein [Steroidobacteraceae bacterium]|nr:lipocalin family protein [Steroidobacteraceae bacterium]